jgi:GNAT superfamily N-acetyltransferase
VTEAIPHDYEFQQAAVLDLSCLRAQQALDLKGQVYDPLEERIELGDPACIRIQMGAKDVGYAILDGKTQPGIALLEFYLDSSHRKNGKPVLHELVRLFHISRWYVSSKDAFGLPLLLECGLPYELDGYIFAVQAPTGPGGRVDGQLGLEAATADDLEEAYQLILQDGFYTGNGRKGLAVRIGNGEIYLLRSDGQLVGAGFVCPLARTPRYADIAMIIDGKHRRQGLGFRLVRDLIQLSFGKGLIPTALTSPENVGSRRTLEKSGFYVDGCMLIATTAGTKAA